MARPTKLTKELLDKARTYEKSGVVPSIEDFALFVELNRDTIYDWREKGRSQEANPLQIEFSDIIERVLVQQSKELMDGGLRNKFNPTITKLLMSKHGYSERQDIEHSGEQKVIVETRRYGSAKEGKPE